MKNIQIMLTNPNEAQEFVNIASKYDCDISLNGSNCYLDAKSFLGVITQGLMCRLTVNYDGNDETFIRSIRKFAVA